jgi:biofilm PGA synthesis N-glycosyltransferase PgaC
MVILMVRIFAVVPAHNEAAVIAKCIDGLRAQTVQPDRIIVVCDNCDDKTSVIAQRAGAHVMHTLNNVHKKAGALNQAIAKLLPLMRDDDFILIQDADSRLDGNFIENALRYHTNIRGLGAVGGIFHGSEGGGFVGHLQRNEYARYARDVARLNGKCLVVTGTAAMLRAITLQRVSRERLDGKLPNGDGHGGVYDTSVLTEDNELTFALLHLGYKVLSPPDCTLVTEVMPTWKALWNQRERWKRGAVENCFQYGLTNVTWRYWGRQLLTAVGIIVTIMYLVSIVWSIYRYGGVYVHPVWLVVTGIFVVERVVTVRYRGWRYMLIAATMYEVLYDMFLQLIHLKAYSVALMRQERKW